MTTFLHAPMDTNLFYWATIHQHCKISSKTQALIPDIHLSLNLNLISNNLENPSWLNYMLSQSSLKKNETWHYRFISQVNYLLNTPNSSTNNLTFMNANWFGEKILLMTNSCLTTNTFPNNLYKYSTKEIFLKSLKWYKYLTLGIRVTK